MDIITDEKLDELFNQLPEKLQDYILSEDTMVGVDAILHIHKITDDNIKPKFRRQVLALMVGAIPAEAFMQNIQILLGLKPEDAEDLFDNLAEEVLEKAWAIAAGQTTSETANSGTGSSSIPTPVPPSAITPIQSKPDATPAFKNQTTPATSFKPEPFLAKPVAPAQPAQPRPATTPKGNPMPTNLPAEYHDMDPMLIKSFESPKRPLVGPMRIDALSHSEPTAPTTPPPAPKPATPTMPPPVADSPIQPIPPKPSPAADALAKLAAEKRAETKPTVEKKLVDGDHYVGGDPYRESPEA